MAPERVALTMYQVGFGECLLLSCSYRDALPDGRRERHVLVDFGSTHGPRNGRPRLLPRVAKLITEHCGGRLDAVVVTHRHKDHLSGFGNREAAQVIDSLQPALVLRPWTEDPALPRDAVAPAEDGGDPMHAFAARLAAGQSLAARIEQLVQGASATSNRGELRQMADDQLPNKAAIDFLDGLAKRTQPEYLSSGRPTALEDLVPGIRVRVLGPPTIAQSSAITEARERDPDEFWMLQLQALAGMAPEQLDPRAPARPVGVEPGPVGWLIDRLARQQVGALMRIVRTVDDALNNTSLILMIDAGDKRLLLPGDAQIENWSWSLFNADDADELRGLLAGVDLYKVGHHGSRNATPRSLFRLWGEDPDPNRPMAALMSTMADVHGDSVATAVPRATLVEALTRRMDVFARTDTLTKDEQWVTVEAPCAGREPFRISSVAEPVPA